MTAQLPIYTVKKLNSFQEIFTEADFLIGVTPNFPITLTDIPLEDERSDEISPLENELKYIKEEFVNIYVTKDIRDWNKRKIFKRKKTEHTAFLEDFYNKKLKHLFSLVDWEYDVYNSISVSHPWYEVDHIDKFRQAQGTLKIDWEHAVEWNREELDINQLTKSGENDKLLELVRPEISLIESFDTDVEVENIETVQNLDSNLNEEIQKALVIETQEAVPLSKAEREYKMLQDKADRLKQVNVRANVAAPILKMSEGKKAAIEEQQGSKLGRRFATVLEHARFAEQHKNCKTDLLLAELRNFHRPRLSSSMKSKTWEIVFHKSANNQKLIERRSRFKVSQDIENVSLVEGEFICVEYIEEFPPILSNIGMASKIINYHRCTDDNSKNSSKSSQDESIKNAIENLDQNNQRVPRHFRLLLEQRSKKSNIESGDANLPKLALGKLEILGENDEFPFLGSLEKGQVQTSICTNMFSAPIFPQKKISNDFLLIRIKVQPKLVTFAIREIEKIYVCGQLEPYQKVPKPIKKMNLTKEQEDFITLNIVRYFHSHFEINHEGIEFDSIKDMFRVSRYKPAYSEANLKRIMRQFADELDEKWYLKNFYRDKRNSALEAAEKERRFSVDKLESSFKPEYVCLQESCNANEVRLLDAGIENIELSKLELWLTRMVQILGFYEKRSRTLSKGLKVMNQPEGIFKLNKLKLLFDKKAKAIKEKVEMGRYIWRRLANASWNTTEAFVDSLGSGRLELDNIWGDPSGRKEGFSYIK